MNEREYILAGNFSLLDALYESRDSWKREVERQKQITEKLKTRIKELEKLYSNAIINHD